MLLAAKDYEDPDIAKVEQYKRWRDCENFTGDQQSSPASTSSQSGTAHFELSAEQIERLNNLAPAAGERHNEGSMAVIDR